MKVTRMSHGEVQNRMVQNDKVAKSQPLKKKILKQSSYKGVLDKQGNGKGKKD